MVWVMFRFSFSHPCVLCVCVFNAAKHLLHARCLLELFAKVLFGFFSKMALTLVSILISAIPVTYCFPTAFEDLGEMDSEYRLVFGSRGLPQATSSPLCACLYDQRIGLPSSSWL